VRRGEVYIAELGRKGGRRPVLIVTRTAALASRRLVTVAPVTRTIRGIASELPLGRAHGLRARSVANCDVLVTIERSLLQERPVWRLSADDTAQLDRTLRFALWIRA
jgi:mRNA interferase MazF